MSLLDDLEAGPWPQFVEDLKKKNNKKLNHKQATDCINQECKQTPNEYLCAMCSGYMPPEG